MLEVLEVEALMSDVGDLDGQALLHAEPHLPVLFCLVVFLVIHTPEGGGGGVVGVLWGRPGLAAGLWRLRG